MRLTPLRRAQVPGQLCIATSDLLLGAQISFVGLYITNTTCIANLQSLNITSNRAKCNVVPGAVVCAVRVAVSLGSSSVSLLYFRMAL